MLGSMKSDGISICLNHLACKKQTQVFCTTATEDSLLQERHVIYTICSEMDLKVLHDQPQVASSIL